MVEPSARDLVDTAIKVTGLSMEELAERLEYKSLKRIVAGEFPLPASKRRHISDLIDMSRMRQQLDTRVVESDPEIPKIGETSGVYVTGARGRLQAALRQAKMTPSDLAKRIGYQGRIIGEVVDGRGRLSTNMLKKIQEVFPQLSDEDLLEGSDSPRIIDPTGTTGTMGDRALIRGAGTRLIPLVSEAQAGPNAAFTDDFYTHEGVSVDPEIDDFSAFALLIRGDSMEDKISAGDKVIVCPQWDLRNGDIVICRISKTADIMCKLYQPKSGGKAMVLSSYNPAYPPRDFLARDLDWIFPVVEVRKTIRR